MLCLRQTFVLQCYLILSLAISNILPHVIKSELKYQGSHETIHEFKQKSSYKAPFLPVNDKNC